MAGGGSPFCSSPPRHMDGEHEGALSDYFDITLTICDQLVVFRS